MKTRAAVAALVFMIVQAVLFGVGTLAVLATPASQYADPLLAYVIVVSFLISVPVSWLIAPNLMARFNPPRLLS